jgi:hypothetical protein
MWQQQKLLGFYFARATILRSLTKINVTKPRLKEQISPVPFKNAKILWLMSPLHTGYKTNMVRA